MSLDHTRDGTRAGASLLFDPQRPLRAVGDTGTGIARERPRYLGHLHHAVPRSSASKRSGARE
jgi:hypothetical protein